MPKAPCLYTRAGTCIRDTEACSMQGALIRSPRAGAECLLVQRRGMY